MLKIAIPKGSLEKGTFKLFEQADLPIRRKNERNYNLFINDPRIEEALLLTAQEIPGYIEDGKFDLGITGLDWIVETGSAVKEVADLEFSRGGWQKVKIIFGADRENEVDSIEDISPKSRVVTEYPKLTRRFLKRHGKGKVSIRGSYGATEIKVPRLADFFVDVTETGETLRSNRKKIIAVIMESSTKLVANIESWDDPEKRKAIEEIASLLLGVLEARGKTLIKLNIAKPKLKSLIKYLPALRDPTISPFYNGAGEDHVMVETVVWSSEINIIVPELKALGAKDILEINISKMIP